MLFGNLPNWHLLKGSAAYGNSTSHVRLLPYRTRIESGVFIVRRRGTVDGWHDLRLLRKPVAAAYGCFSAYHTDQAAARKPESP
jgi:hypothetical protein